MANLTHTDEIEHAVSKDGIGGKPEEELTIPKDVQAPQPEPEVPLTPQEFRKFNRLADQMNLYHNHFRNEWTTLYSACEAGKRPSNLSIRQFLQKGLDFASMLSMHHGIEESYVFPILARKMPAFQKELHLLTQHKEIHKGLDVFEEYLEGCKKKQRELRLGELKDIMDGFGGVLWTHLDDEVMQLGAKNMKKYWSGEEMDGLRFG